MADNLFPSSLKIARTDEHAIAARFIRRFYDQMLQVRQHMVALDLVLAFEAWHIRQQGFLAEIIADHVGYVGIDHLVVRNTGTLGGTGSIGAALTTVESGGRVSAGVPGVASGAGTLTFTGDLTTAAERPTLRAMADEVRESLRSLVDVTGTVMARAARDPDEIGAARTEVIAGRNIARGGADGALAKRQAFTNEA